MIEIYKLPKNLLEGYERMDINKKIFLKDCFFCQTGEKCKCKVTVFTKVTVFSVDHIDPEFILLTLFLKCIKYPQRSFKLFSCKILDSCRSFISKFEKIHSYFSYFSFFSYYSHYYYYFWF